MVPPPAGGILSPVRAAGPILNAGKHFGVFHIRKKFLDPKNIQYSCFSGTTWSDNDHKFAFVYFKIHAIYSMNFDFSHMIGFFHILKLY